ncbi:PGF-pre-PGF domain-containing protein [Methanococcoides sp. AM1]|uniref:PGF-pre-PGF domain-containing protein n=1 Tax=Methanococcoides sp. AM1 TaxID=1201011 RepID=UPI001438541F|nr:PGF-pre-PGF domain-containing protein [Methanococcoides sp. AM1]
MSVGNATAEAFENIDEKDVAVRYVLKDLEKSFTFRNEGIDITYINISTDLTVGDVKAIVESLKSTSSMISTPVEGKVYKNINIWVGDSKLKHRLITSDVGFRVNRTWLEDNGVSEQSVKLTIYRSGGWHILPTEKVGEDDEYIYYEAPTSGDLRTHFAVVEYVESEPVSLDTEEAVPEPGKEDPALSLEGDKGIVASESGWDNGSGPKMMFFALPVLMVLILVSASYVALAKDPQVKARDRNVDFPDDLQVTEGDVSETATPDQVGKVQSVAIKQKINALEDSGILSDVVQKNKK